MVQEHKDYRSYLKWALADRIAKNPSYSLRSFANKLGIHHSMLVQLFQHKKRLSIERAHSISKNLGLNGKEAEYFCLLVEIENAKNPDQKSILMNRLRESFPDSQVRDLTVDHFQMISEWYHLPILQMVGLKHSLFNPTVISKRLSISKIEAELAIERLERLELIEKDESGNYRKTNDSLITKSSVPSDALRKYHQQMLTKAIESLDSQLPTEKWIGSETLAMDSKLMPEAAKIIEQFLDRMVQLSFKSENRDHIYHLSTCYFKLTKNTNGETNEN